MPIFKSADSYGRFARKVLTSTRYVLDDDSRDFLTALVRHSKDHKEILSAGEVFWRAQLGHAWQPFVEDEQYICDLPAAFPPQRMKPLADRAPEGRANPKGIPYLYLATDKDTALSEIRPWRGSLISLAQFKTTRELVVVNLSNAVRPERVWSGAMPPGEWDKRVLFDLDEAFAKPVVGDEDHAAYAPTQIIAETFKVHQFDGIAYRSSVGPGHNIALFDIAAARFFNCCSLFETESVKFTFAERDTYPH